MDAGLAVLSALAAYLLGSIPSAYVLLRLTKGMDIRTAGTGNVGALNAYQQLGPAGGLVVLAADVSKGLIAVLLPSWIGAPDWASYVGAFAVLAGHNWPVFLNFRGGKGAATILGVGLALAPPLAGIALIPVILLALGIRNVVVGALAGFLTFNVLTIATGESLSLVVVCWALTLGVIANYTAKGFKQIASAVKARRWRHIIFPE